MVRPHIIRIWLAAALAVVLLSGCFEAGKCGSCGQVLRQCLEEGQCVSDETIVCPSEGREIWADLSRCVCLECEAECEGICQSGPVSPTCLEACRGRCPFQQCLNE